MTEFSIQMTGSISENPDGGERREGRLRRRGCHHRKKEDNGHKEENCCFSAGSSQPASQHEMATLNALGLLLTKMQEQQTKVEKCNMLLSLPSLNDFQPVYQGTLVCHKWFIDVPWEFGVF